MVAAGVDTAAWPTRSDWKMTPRQSIEAECLGRSKPAVTSDGCHLIMGEATEDALISDSRRFPGSALLNSDEQHGAGGDRSVSVPYGRMPR